MVTRFECPSLWALMIIMLKHWRMKKDVRQRAQGHLDVTMAVRLRERTLLNISLWEDLESIYSMGQVRRHVDATRLPARLGVATSGGVYPFAGDWRQVMFASTRPGRPPLRPNSRRNP